MPEPGVPFTYRPEMPAPSPDVLINPPLILRVRLTCNQWANVMTAWTLGPEEKAQVLVQFLIESVLLSVIGGLVGVAVGLIGSRFRIVGVQPVIVPYSIFLAFGVALAVGVFCGFYPANRAASLRPIDALRYE